MNEAILVWQSLNTKIRVSNIYFWVARSCCCFYCFSLINTLHIYAAKKKYESHGLHRIYLQKNDGERLCFLWVGALESVCKITGNSSFLQQISDVVCITHTCLTECTWTNACEYFRNRLYIHMYVYTILPHVCMRAYMRATGPYQLMWAYMI